MRRSTRQALAKLGSGQWIRFAPKGTGDFTCWLTRLRWSTLAHGGDLNLVQGQDGVELDVKYDRWPCNGAPFF